MFSNVAESSSEPSAKVICCLQKKETQMKTMLMGIAALAGVAIATPALAQHHGGHFGGHWGGHGHWRGGPSIGFSFGGPGYGYYDAPYAYACESVRVRHVTPSGRVVYRWVRQC